MDKNKFSVGNYQSEILSFPESIYDEEFEHQADSVESIDNVSFQNSPSFLAMRMYTLQQLHLIRITNKIETIVIEDESS